jgi:hypothetical protein
MSQMGQLGRPVEQCEHLAFILKVGALVSSQGPKGVHMMVMRRFLLGTCLSAVVLFGVAGSAVAHEYKALFLGNFSGANSIPEQVFKFGSVTVECLQILVKGTLPTPSTKVQMVPTYNTCKSNLTATATTSTTTKCAYELFEPVVGGIEYLAEMAIVNDGGTCELEFNTHAGCVLVIVATPKRQTDELKDIAPASVHLIFALSKISYKHSGAGCTGIGTGTDAFYEGLTNVENITVV